MPDTISREEKHRRVKVLREISLRKKENFAKRFSGRTMEVLVEENNKGITGNYIHVSVKQNADFIKGQLYNIKL
jgi:threonylcarbamoyladenosine tRNA methylthiotransferase MtaB